MLGIFLDSETNGLDCFVHKVLDLAYKIIDLESGKIIETFQSTVLISKQDWERSDPNSLAMNGFKFEQIQTSPTPEQVGSKIIKSFQDIGISRDNAVFICQNPSFDRPFFSQLVPSYIQEENHYPYHWLDLASMFFAYSLLKGEHVACAQLSKNQIAKALELPLEEGKHKAMNGVNHLVLCYHHIIGFPRASQLNQSSSH